MLASTWLERFEDTLLMLGRNPGTGVAHYERNLAPLRRGVARRDREADFAFFGELDSISQ